MNGASPCVDIPKGDGGKHVELVAAAAICFSNATLTSVALGFTSSSIVAVGT